MNNNLVKGRMWSFRSGATMPQNMKAALDYFRGKYGDEFEAILVPTMSLLNLGLTEYDGIKLIESGSVPKGHIFLRLKTAAQAEEE